MQAGRYEDYVVNPGYPISEGQVHVLDLQGEINMI
jgi:hypothetical protein